MKTELKVTWQDFTFEEYSYEPQRTFHAAVSFAIENNKGYTTGTRDDLNYKIEADIAAFQAGVNYCIKMRPFNVW